MDISTWVGAFRKVTNCIFDLVFLHGKLIQQLTLPLPSLGTTLGQRMQVGISDVERVGE